MEFGKDLNERKETSKMKIAILVLRPLIVLKFVSINSNRTCGFS